MANAVFSPPESLTASTTEFSLLCAEAACEAYSLHGCIVGHNGKTRGIGRNTNLWRIVEDGGKALM